MTIQTITVTINGKGISISVASFSRGRTVPPFGTASSSELLFLLRCDEDDASRGVTGESAEQMKSHTK
eukprot:TRINITY_DN5890_c0_g1_i1.p1 TRINITY_DN5890_c0_g1~~TRINITY_DN5890_c0_g1_i1.p1  ORF type:complete len:68 (-),score=18.24 TRINITY_DN5890_c0_g1_i1:381-584(-)